MYNLNNNPFTPTFGSIPLHLAGRERLISDVLNGLNNGPGDPNRATIYIGARGSGKTVLLTKIAEEASANGWVSVNVNAQPDMLDDILIQIRDNAAHILEPESVSFISSIVIGGAGITRSEKTSTKRTTWRSEMTLVIKELNSKGVGLLITVDELNVKINELRSLIVTFQHFVRERRDVALIMAGLPTKVSDLLRDDSISFLRRAFQHNLEPIDNSEVRYSLKRTINLAEREIDTKALELAAKSTMGFAFMIQLIGYHVWRQKSEEKTIGFEDVHEGIALAHLDLERMIFDNTYRDLSENDISFLEAMLEDNEFSKVADIAKRMNVTPKYAGMYRARLIEQGIIGNRGYGKVSFDLPMFREYVKKRANI
jgi:hypothetical protein